MLVHTVYGSVEERVKDLDFGADDYMTKPFSLQEFEARKCTLGRRILGASSSGVKFDPLTYDLPGRVVTIADQMVELTPRELTLLKVLLRRAKGLVTTNQLVDRHASGAKMSASTPLMCKSSGCTKN